MNLGIIASAKTAVYLSVIAARYLTTLCLAIEIFLLALILLILYYVVVPRPML